MVVKNIRKTINDITYKRCPECRKWLPLNKESFHRNQYNDDGFCSYCKLCTNERKRKAYRENPRGRFESNFKYKYGISYEDYKKLEEEQESKCKICGGPLETAPTNNRWNNHIHHFSIDHDHKTGKIRGLLCVKCNAGIGYFDHNPDKLYKAIKYIEDFKKKMEEKND